MKPRRKRPPLPAGFVSVRDLIGSPGIDRGQARANRAARPPGSRTLSGLRERVGFPGLVPLDALGLWQAVDRGEFPKPLRGPWGIAWVLDDVLRWRTGQEQAPTDRFRLPKDSHGIST